MNKLRTWLSVLILMTLTGIVFAAPIDINTADAAALANAITGVGQKKAQLIVDYRESHGPFATIDDLAKVKGIGPKTIEKNRANITAGGTKSAATRAPATSSAPAKSSSSTTSTTSSTASVPSAKPKSK
jgi:competence protein ComEA